MPSMRNRNKQARRVDMKNYAIKTVLRLIFHYIYYAYNLYLTKEEFTRGK